MPVRPIPGYPDEIPKRPEGYSFNDFNYSPLGLLNTKYMWNTWGDNCTICNALRGKVYTLDFWANAGLWPGFHVGCDCTMKKVPDDTPTSDLDFFGMNVPQYANMWMPIPNQWWDPTYKIQPYQMDLISQIEQMHLVNGADMPFSEMLKNIGGFFYPRGPGAIGDTVGWRVLATRRVFENIDGSWDGDKLFTFEHLRWSLEPLFEWFYPKWLRKSHNEINSKYAANTNRLGLPGTTLQPAPLRPWQPFQTYYTEVE